LLTVTKLTIKIFFQSLKALEKMLVCELT